MSTFKKNQIMSNGAKVLLAFERNCGGAILAKTSDDYVVWSYYPDTPSSIFDGNSFPRSASKSVDESSYRDALLAFHYKMDDIKAAQ